MTEEEAYRVYSDEEIKLLSNCTLCPRECRVNRLRGETGYCGTDAGMNIASICIHRGEEPPVSGPAGICNIFFAGCNLHCIYCQNYDISRSLAADRSAINTLEETLNIIENILSENICAVGFVSPSHVIPQVKAIIRGLHKRGLKPITVYNTNSYDKPGVIDSLNGMIDVYLPDYKYVSKDLSREYSDAPMYPVIALKALKRMYYQKGSTLPCDGTGRAERGILIRHLVLPGHSGESMSLLHIIAEELSPGMHMSLMSQYHPVPMVSKHFLLGRIISKSEYDAVVETAQKLGFRNVWVQDMDSYRNYMPDFSKEHPFE